MDGRAFRDLVVPTDGKPRKVKRGICMMSVGSGPGKGGGKPPGPTVQGEERKQDWIGNQLRRVYDEALQEAIPEDMLRLLDELDSSEEDED